MNTDKLHDQPIRCTMIFYSVNTDVDLKIEIWYNMTIENTAKQTDSALSAHPYSAHHAVLPIKPKKSICV